MKTLMLALLGFGLLISIQGWCADYEHPLYLSVRSLALGGAVTSSVQDEQSLYLNPAGLSRVRDLKLTLASLAAEGSTQLVYHSGEIKTANDHFGVDSLNQLVGKNNFGKVQVNSTLAVLGFGMGVIGDGEVSSRLVNQVSPSGELGTLGTYGVQVGYGLKIAQFKRSRGRVDFGVAGKYLVRGGKMQIPPLSALVGLNKDVLFGDVKGVGQGLGLDLGLQMSYLLNDQLELLSGVVMSDVGYTSFSNRAPRLAPYLAGGIGLRLKRRDVVATLTYDYQRVTESVDWKKKNHLGLELKLPVISLYAGLNGLFIPTVGMGLNLAFAQFMVASTAQELGTTIGQNTERRIAAQVQLKFDF